MKVDFSSQENRDRLMSMISAAQEEASQLRSKLGETVEWAQYIEDLAEVMKEWLQIIPTDENLASKHWTLASWAWERTRKDISELDNSFDVPSGIALSGSLSTTTASGLMFEPSFMNNIAADKQQTVDGIYSKYNALAESRDWSNETEQELTRLQFQQSSGKDRNPIELFHEAQAALAKPSTRETSPSAVLIPIREAIQSCLADLLRRRPRQEKTPNIESKILSIMSHMKRDNVSQQDGENFAAQAKSIINDLSGSKNDRMSREQVRALLISAISFLKAFLGSLDADKMR